MQHFKALKETTFGSRFVFPGEIVAMDEASTPDTTVWVPVSGEATPPTGMESGAPAMTADVPPAMLMDQARAQHEYQQKELDKLAAQNAALTAERDDIHAALMQKRQEIAALHEERQAMQAEHHDLMQKMQDEVTALKTENTTLKKKK